MKFSAVVLAAMPFTAHAIITQDKLDSYQNPSSGIVLQMPKTNCNLGPQKEKCGCDQPVLTRDGCKEAALLLSNGANIYKNSNYVDVTSSSGKPYGCSMKTSTNQLYFNTNTAANGWNGMYAPLCHGLKTAKVEAVAVAAKVEAVAVAVKSTKLCDAANCLSWSCEEWCKCYSSESEYQGIYDREGCVEDGTACSCP